jgi:hypothetical protein
LVGTLPQSASAQTDEEGATSEPNLEQPAAPSSESAPEEPALQLKLDDAGVDVTPTAEGFYILPPPEESALQLKARAWLIGTAVVTAIGVPLLAVGLTYDRRQPPSEGLDLDFTGVGLATAGGIMLFVGVPGMAVSGGTLGISKRKLRRLEQAHYGTGRRVQWDLSESRLVF